MVKFIYNFNDTLIKGFYDDEPKKRIFENGACFLDAQGEFCSLIEAETLVIVFGGNYDELREQLAEGLKDMHGVGIVPKLEAGVYTLNEGVCKQAKGIERFFDFGKIERKLDSAIFEAELDEAFIEGFTVEGEN